MLQDLERGRPMEIDALVGAVTELGRLVEVATPTIDVVLGLLDLRERRRAPRMVLTIRSARDDLGAEDGARYSPPLTLR